VVGTQRNFNLSICPPFDPFDIAYVFIISFFFAMTAATLSPRPLSLLHPSTSAHSPSDDHLSPLRRSQSPVTSHYRPFSIHILEVDSEPRRRSIIRSPSLSGMGFSFKDRKDKEKEKEKGHPKTVHNPPKAFNTFPGRPGSPLRSATTHLQDATDRPSTSNGLFNTFPKEKGLRKKRSLSSLLSAASEVSPTTSTLPSRSGSSSPYPQPPRSPLGRSNSTKLSPVDESGAPDNAAIKTGEEKPRPRRRPVNNFVRKNTWLKRQNMKVHPYPLEATYMQAYEPLQLEKCVAHYLQT
jgi:hypothetical protein